MLSLDELERIGLTPSTSPFLRSPRRLSMKHLEKTTDGIDYVLAGQLGRQGRGKVRANRRQIENCSLNRLYILQIATSLLSHVAKRTVYSRRTARSANPFSAPTLHFELKPKKQPRICATVASPCHGNGHQKLRVCPTPTGQTPGGRVAANSASTAASDSIGFSGKTSS